MMATDFSGLSERRIVVAGWELAICVSARYASGAGVQSATAASTQRQAATVRALTYQLLALIA
jgi:hypothetical protein